MMGVSKRKATKLELTFSHLFKEVTKMCDTTVDMSEYDRKDQRCFSTFMRGVSPQAYGWRRWRKMIKYFETDVHLSFYLKQGGSVDPVAQSILEVNGFKVRPRKLNLLTKWFPGKSYS